MSAREINIQYVIQASKDVKTASWRAAATVLNVLLFIFTNRVIELSTNCLAGEEGLKRLSNEQEDNLVK